MKPQKQSVLDVEKKAIKVEIAINHNKLISMKK